MDLNLALEIKYRYRQYRSREDETVLELIVPMPVYEAVGERRKAIDEDRHGKTRGEADRQLLFILVDPQLFGEHAFPPPFL